MSETKKGLWARLTSKLVSQGGAAEPEEMSFRRLPEATKIEVQTKLNQRVKTIEDPAIIKAVLEFVQSQKAGWLTPKFQPLSPTYGWPFPTVIKLWVSLVLAQLF